MKSILLSFLVLGVLSNAASAKDTVRLQIPNYPLPEGQVIGAADDWWGVWGEDPSLLKKAKVTLVETEWRTVVKAECLTSQSDCESGSPNFLFANVPGLKEGKITRATTISENKDEVIFNFQDKPVRLYGAVQNSVYEVHLEVGSRQQIIYENKKLDEIETGVSGWAVLWVGDIDRDQKIDLLVHTGRDPIGEYEWSVNRLYLSSYAKEREIVSQVATFLESPGD